MISLSLLRNVRASCRRVGAVPKNCGAPHEEVLGSYTLRKLDEQSHVCPPKRYIRPSVPIAAEASDVVAGREGRTSQGGEEELNS